MPLNSGNKGKAFERRVAALLKDWTGFKFSRTPMSGAHASEPGDILCLEPTIQFPFCVECKHEEGWELDNLIQLNGPFPGWLSQTLEQATRKSAETWRIYWPMLFFKRNHRPIYVLLPRFVSMAGGGIKQNHIIIKSPVGQYIVGEAANTLQELGYSRIKAYHEQLSSRVIITGNQAGIIANIAEESEG